ncbi:MAG: putative selenate reductase subunit YgfK, partial [Eubacterium sp.]
MSDRMRAIPFGEIINWILNEYKNEGTVFGVRHIFKKEDAQTLSLFGETLETPFGPAAGPHNQLAQNIIAAYMGGSRFFELKTVQPVDGDDLAACVAKPCITAADECYNCEWSTELYVPEAFNEYIKAWFIIKLLAKEFNIGSPDGFIFNMSVGYDFEGVKSEKINTYIDGMMNAENTEIWKECMDFTLGHLSLFDHIDAAYVKAISPIASRSITLSTLHGCPPDEIEKIASYLINEKGLNTFVKCNPTMLGYDSAREILDTMGYDYLFFYDFHFTHDLHFSDAVPMFTRLKKEAAHKNVDFGVKITNTFPQKVVDGILPSEDMYMSGRSLFPCSIELANRLAKAFNGDLRISYSGGADIFNIKDILAVGIWPITLATTLLKPGGYNRLNQMAEDLVSYHFKEVQTLKPAALSILSKRARTNPHNIKGAIKPLPSRKFDKKVPLVDCFTAPCSEACPISQDIPDYIELLGQNKPLEALKVITAKNALPFITGTICNHRCMDKCTRNFYESPLCIRDVKLNAAALGFDDLLKEIKPVEKTTDAKVAVIGGGPAGISAAYFLARNGVSVTIFERKESLGGIVRHVVPAFRVDAEIVEHDVALMKAYGVEVITNTEIDSADALKEKGFKYVIAATGAWGNSPYQLEGDQAINVLDFLGNFRKDASSLNLGKDVVVI